MKKYLIIFICLWGGVGFSCSNWLDVKPSDRISEDNNFSSLVGFKKTLNGVYIELNSSDLYGKNLSCEFIEILAQRYAIGDENKSNKELRSSRIMVLQEEVRLQVFGAQPIN